MRMVASRTRSGGGSSFTGPLLTAPSLPQSPALCSNAVTLGAARTTTIGDADAAERCERATNGGAAAGPARTTTMGEAEAPPARCRGVPDADADDGVGFRWTATS